MVRAWMKKMNIYISASKNSPDFILNYGIQVQFDPKFSDRQVCTNSLDPDQTAPAGAVWSGSKLFAIPSASFTRITL